MTRMIPLHEVRDEAKLRELIASMDADGWQGAPLVVCGDQLITGTHRYAATQELGWADHDIPTIELAELFEMAGLDMAEVHAEHGCPTLDDPAFAEFLGELPADIREEYGIDLH